MPNDILSQRIRRLQITTRRLAEEMMTGLYRSAFKGRGMEFEEVREYQPGDEVRHIDWNVTARMQHPYTKVFREEREIVVWILVDISKSTNYGSKTTLKREYIAEVTALLAFAATKNNDRVGLILFSDHIEGIFSPNKGKSHTMRLVREVMVRESSSSGSNLAVALLRLGRLQQRRCVCFIVSDFLYPVAPRLSRLMARHHDIIAIMVGDPAEQEFPLSSSLVSMVDIETGKSHDIDWSVPLQLPLPLVERWREHTQLLQDCGADVIQLKTDQPSFHNLCTFFRLRSKRMTS